MEIKERLKTIVMKTDNELIAEFMGWRPVIEYAATGDYQGHWVNPVTHQRWHDPRNVPFDLFWDWLMPVVEKIGKMDEEMELDLPITASISEVHEAVVEFIKWYNTQKSQPEAI